MRTKTHVFIFISLFAIGAMGKEVKVNSKIKSITVFTRGAQIFRSATVKLTPGEQLIIFPELSSYMNPASIQMGGQGSLTILSVAHRQNYLEVPNKAQQEQELSDKLEEINAQIAETNALVQVYQEEENLLLTNKNLGGQHTGVNIEQLKQAAEFYRTRLTEIKTKKIALAAQIKELREEYNKVNGALRQITSSRGKTTAEVVVKVDVDQTTTAKFLFNYTVNNASWQPFYDIRLTDLNKPIALEYKAKVNQRTGVDWNNVALTLSSGNPNKNNVLPAVSPWYVDYAANAAFYRGARAEADMYTVESDDKALLEEVVITSADMAKSKQAMKVPSAMVIQKVTNFEYAIKNRYTIKSSNLPEDVAVKTIEVDASFEYHANTKLDQTAYLMAKLFNWHNYNLLNGQAKLFNQGTFVGQTYLDVETTSDTLLLSMGRDDNIIIKRERLVDMNGSQTLGDKQKLTRYWTLALRNKKTSAVKLVVTDQIPVSRQKQIVVKLEEASGAIYNANTGYLKWVVNLNPASNTELKFGYSVKHPKDKRVTLND